ncbi:MAG: aldehyde:ferredoxin oxidoreductase [Clostridia bacterium]|nr:aldehyde:ferredoxin oxidoreductase [Clostridia bacterium]
MHIARVDLINQSIMDEEISPEIIKAYLGGRGLGSWYIWHSFRQDPAAFSRQDPLIFLNSPLTGTGAPGAVKLTAVARSPLTGAIGMSFCGGQAARVLRQTGYDGFIITGKAPRPLYLVIEDGAISFREASSYRGWLTGQVESRLQEEYPGQEVAVLSIGPAGENGVKYASIMHAGHAFGRGGLGAVMGAKNLKAIALVSNRGKKPALAPGFNAAVRELNRKIARSPRLQMFGVNGTAGNVKVVNERGLHPAYYYQHTQFDKLKDLAGIWFAPYIVKREGCFACPIRCRKLVALEAQQEPWSGPEYETLWSFGANCGNANVKSILEANYWCNEYGLDTISTGNCIGFLMACRQRWFIDAGPAFGDVESFAGLIRSIAYKEGLGALVADGVRPAARKLGCEGLAMQVKGMELSGYDPRGAKGMGLGYATSPRGACHERGFIPQEVFGSPPPLDRYSPEKAELVIRRQNEVAVLDSLGICVFSSGPDGFDLETAAGMLSLATGMDFSAADLYRCGERICNVERLFNCAHGFTSQEDTLPARFLREPDAAGPSAGQVVELEYMLARYYKLRGWNEDGIPSAATLKRLALEG